MTLAEKAAYLKGLMDGIKLDSAGKITDSSELIKTIKEDWGDFIETKGKGKRPWEYP